MSQKVLSTTINNTSNFSKMNPTQSVTNVLQVSTPHLQDYNYQNDERDEDSYGDNDTREPFDTSYDVEPFSQHNDPGGFIQISHNEHEAHAISSPIKTNKNVDKVNNVKDSKGNILRRDTSHTTIASDAKFNNPNNKANNNNNNNNNATDKDKNNNTNKNKLGPANTLVRDRQIDDPQQIKKQVAQLNARLPRPDWYSSGEDEAQVINFKDKSDQSDFKAEQPQRGMFLYPLVACAIGFIFVFIATCPIPWIRGHDGRQYNIWYAQGANQPRLRTNHIVGCTNEMQYWQVLCGISIIATFAACGALISVILLLCKKGHLGASFILIFYSFVFTLMAWAVVVALYHHKRCERPAFASGIARLDGGFALMFLAWICYIFALGVLIYHFVRFYTKSVHTGTTKPYRFVHVVLLCVCLLFYCVGPALPVWSRSFNGVTARVSLWSCQVYDKTYDRSTYITRRAYQCTTITRRMKVVAAFDIMTIIWLFFALLCTIAACYHDTKRKWSRFFTWTGVVFGFIAWLILAITRHSHLCTGTANNNESSWVALGYNGIPTGVNNAQIRFDGYGLRSGFALIVTAWCISVIAASLNQYF